MSARPSIFIGSSTESLEYANALQRVLDHALEPTIWTYGVFLPTGNTLAGIIKRATTTDFAALFLTPDDDSTVRGEYLKTPRDNLVFELGLFIGHLGVDRVFLLTPHEGVDLPSDLQGITPLKYWTDRSDKDAQNAVNPAATDIRNAVDRIGPRKRRHIRGRTHVDGPSPDVLCAIARLSNIAVKSGASLEIKRAPAGRFELILVDDTRLGTSIEVDLHSPAAVTAMDRLGETLEMQSP